MEVNDLHFDILLQGGQYDVHFDNLQYQVGYLLFYEYFYQVLDTTLMLPEITKVCKVEVNMISISTFCLWNIVQQHIILGVLGCLTHIENPENGTLLDYIVSYIKVVNLEVTLTSTFYLGDLQYDVHIF